MYTHRIKVVEELAYILKCKVREKQSSALFGVCSHAFKVDRDIICQSEPKLEL